MDCQLGRRGAGSQNLHAWTLKFQCPFGVKADWTRPVPPNQVLHFFQSLLWIRLATGYPRNSAFFQPELKAFAANPRQSCYGLWSSCFVAFPRLFGNKHLCTFSAGRRAFFFFFRIFPCLSKREKHIPFVLEPIVMQKKIPAVKNSSPSPSCNQF